MPTDEKTTSKVTTDAAKGAKTVALPASSKKKYVALTGINFDGRKPPVRIEDGDPLPSGLSLAEINDLLAIGAIKEK